MAPTVACLCDSGMAAVGGFHGALHVRVHVSAQVRHRTAQRRLASHPAALAGDTGRRGPVRGGLTPSVPGAGLLRRYADTRASRARDSARRDSRLPCVRLWCRWRRTSPSSSCSRCSDRTARRTETDFVRGLLAELAKIKFVSSFAIKHWSEKVVDLATGLEAALSGRDKADGSLEGLHESRNYLVDGHRPGADSRCRREIAGAICDRIWCTARASRSWELKKVAHRGLGGREA